MDLVLSYNVATKITHGILTFDGNRLSPLNELLPILRQSPELSAHPLLMPVLTCNAWYEIMASQYGAVHDEIRNNVQVKTDLMPGYFFSQQNKLEDFEVIDQEGLIKLYKRIHQTIVEQHNYLSNGLSYFVKEFSNALISSLNQKPVAFQLDTEIDEDIRSCIEQLAPKTEIELKHRERLLAKLDIQVQVVSYMTARSPLDLLIAAAVYFDAAARQWDQSPDCRRDQERQLGDENPVSHNHCLLTTHRGCSTPS